MSKIKDWLLEMQESAADRKIAQILGIEYEELNSLDWELETDESNDGMVYNYRIEFDPNSPKEILDKIKRLTNGRTVYLDIWELDEDYDYNEQFDAITESKNNIQKFDAEMVSLEALSGLLIADETLKGILNRQIFISVIGTMETYLSDTFLILTLENEMFFRNFIESHPDFEKRKFNLSEIFIQKETLHETAKKVILDTIFHNLPSISPMFKETFNIEFPPIKAVYQDVLRRHDLVHRNGKTKEGEYVLTDSATLTELINRVSLFVHEIEAKLNAHVIDE